MKVIYTKKMYKYLMSYKLLSFKIDNNEHSIQYGK